MAIRHQAAMAAGERIFRLLDEKPGVRNPERPRPLPPPVRGDFAFEEVSFGYSPENPVLHGVSFAVAAGGKRWRWSARPEAARPPS
jgi:ATP-binding cassette subfamily B protein